jgi:DNA (cytosine-5)-methyltransferase 1
MFTGCGGLDLGVAEALGGTRVAWCADPDPHVRLVLAARMPGVPNLGDVGDVDWRRVPPVDVVTAGWPCQDISAAGRRAGLEHGSRSGLWRHIPPAIAALRPSMVVLENVGALRWRGGGLGRVLADLAGVGYDCLWITLRASEVGAAHRRERVFVLAVPASGTGMAAKSARLGRSVQGQAAIAGCWPRSGMTCHGTVRPLALPAAQDGARGSPPLLPTPQARDYNRAQLPEVRRAGGHQVNLSDVARELAENWEHDGWGRHAPAIRGWEQIVGRPAPLPAERTRRGSFRLAVNFAQWCQGLPEDWVSGVPLLPYYAMIRILGNAVVPRQAAVALRQLAGIAAILCPPADARPAAQGDDRAA